MSIRVKLLALAGCTLLLFGAAAGLLALFLAPVAAVGRDRELLADLAWAMKGEAAELNRLPYAGIKVGRESYLSARKAVDSAFAALDDMTVLPKASERTAEALDVVRGMKALCDRRLGRLDADRLVLEGEMRDALTFVDNSSYLALLDRDSMSPAVAARAKALVPGLRGFMTSLSIAQESLSSSAASIAGQYRIIDDYIAAAKRRAVAAAIGAVCAIAAGSLAFALAIANGIARAIISLERDISALRAGDLRPRSRLGRRDELGALSIDLDGFLDALSESLARVKDISGANLGAKERLLEAFNGVSQAVEGVAESSGAVEARAGELKSSIEDSSASMSKIAHGIEVLNGQILGQLSMVEETSASVAQVLSSLGAMGQAMDRDREAIRAMVGAAERGKASFEEASGRISGAAADIEKIRELASVIGGVAERTNLLAMNASIEAAHAGEAGRGFSIVADEIRRLSDETDESSRSIAQSISPVLEAMEDALGLTACTRESFSSIEAMTREASSTFEDILGGIDEIRRGSGEIIEAMTQLRDRSASVRAGSSSMEEGAAGIGRMTEGLDLAARGIEASVVAIGRELGDIRSAMESVMGLSGILGEGSARLDAEVGKFKTSSPPFLENGE